MCTELNIVKLETKGKLGLIQTIMGYLKKEELDLEKLQAIFKAIIMRNASLTTAKKKDTEKLYMIIT